MIAIVSGLMAVTTPCPRGGPPRKKLSSMLDEITKARLPDETIAAGAGVIPTVSAMGPAACPKAKRPTMLVVELATRTDPLTMITEPDAFPLGKVKIFEMLCAA